MHTRVCKTLLYSRDVIIDGNAVCAQGTPPHAPKPRTEARSLLDTSLEVSARHSHLCGVAVARAMKLHSAQVSEDRRGFARLTLELLKTLRDGLRAIGTAGECLYPLWR